MENRHKSIFSEKVFLQKAPPAKIYPILYSKVPNLSNQDADG